MFPTPTVGSCVCRIASVPAVRYQPLRLKSDERACLKTRKSNTVRRLRSPSDTVNGTSGLERPQSHSPALRRALTIKLRSAGKGCLGWIAGVYAQIAVLYSGLRPAPPRGPVCALPPSRLHFSFRHSAHVSPKDTPRRAKPYFAARVTARSSRTRLDEHGHRGHHDGRTPSQQRNGHGRG